MSLITRSAERSGGGNHRATADDYPAVSGARDLGRPVEALARILRVPAFAGCTVLLAVLAHLLAGGTTPGAGPVLLLTAVTALLWRVAARAELSLPRLLLGVTGAQFGLHIALLDHPGHRPTAVALLAHLGAAALLALVLRRHELLCWRRRVAALAGLAEHAALRLAAGRGGEPTAECTVQHPALDVRIPPRRGPPLRETAAA